MQTLRYITPLKSGLVIPSPTFHLYAPDSNTTGAYIKNLGTIGSSLDFKQTTSANQPTLTTSASLNGKQVLSFSKASATNMTTTTGSTAVLDGSKSFTLMLAISWHSGADVVNFLTFGNFATTLTSGLLLLQTSTSSGAPTFNDIFWGGGTYWAEGRYNGIGWSSPLSSAVPQLFELSCHVAGGVGTLSNYSLAYNKTVETISTVSFGNQDNFNVLGAPSTSNAPNTGYCGSFDFGEMRIYQPALTSAQQASVRATMAAYWGF